MNLPDIIVDPEFQKLIPPLTIEELRQLEENLITHGCRQPLTIWNGTLLDGHNRLAICRKHNISFKIEEIKNIQTRDAAKAWIIKNQLGRRNLGESQRAMLAATLQDVFATAAKERELAGKGADGSGGRGHSINPVSNLTQGLSGRARDQAAAVMNVSSGLVHAAEKVKSRGSEKLQQAVMAGEASVSAAAEVATLPPDEQDKVVASGSKEILAAAKKIRRARARSGRREISPDALRPVRGAVSLPAKTALELPHDPVWAAKTLISVFDREFLVGLVSEITLFLQGDNQ